MSDEEDPFAGEDEIGSGLFIPKPSLEVLDGRFIVLVPRKYEEAVPIPEDFRQPGGPTERERVTADMVVFGPGGLEYDYFDKNDKTDGQDGSYKKWTIEDDAMPFMFTGVWRVEAAIVGPLKRLMGTRKPILSGIVRRGPLAKDRGKENFESIEAARQAWIAAGKPERGPIKNPRFSWQIDIRISSDQAAQRLNWWNNAKANGYRL